MVLVFGNMCSANRAVFIQIPFPCSPIQAYTDKLKKNSNDNPEKGVHFVFSCITYNVNTHYTNHYSTDEKRNQIKKYACKHNKHASHLSIDFSTDFNIKQSTEVYKKKI